MKGIKKLYKLFFYCGIGKDEYDEIRRDAYSSNFVIWHILHIFMVILFASLFAISLVNDILKINAPFYLAAFIYSLLAAFSFFILRKDSLLAQHVIYVSISLLLVLGCFITRNNPKSPATTFIAFLLITPMVLINRPVFMTIELCCASAFLLIWMYNVKPLSVWQQDLVNVIIFTVVSVFLNVIANSIRIKEFVLQREISFQKDTDELTGLKNKGALTRKINEFLADPESNKGLMFMLDIDRFKNINDSYGHDLGDEAISQIGHLLGEKFIDDEIVGRFGGDEFILFIKNTNDVNAAQTIADSIIIEVARTVTLPETSEKISVSIGIAIYNGKEKTYSEILKKADIALYKAKANSDIRYCIYSE